MKALSLTFILRATAPLLLLVAADCISSSEQNPETLIAPEQAVMLAAAAAPEGVPGIFAMQVKGAGRDRQGTYLNSEADYRDQRSLTIVLSEAAVRQLTETLGSDPVEALVGRDIRVRGSAFRVRIVLRINGQATDKYYQTHVRVDDAARIEVL